VNTALLSRLRIELRYLVSLRRLPLDVAMFMLRARRTAQRGRDDFSLLSATRPANLALLLELAHGRRRVIELGSGTGWTALALAIDDPEREVVSFDPIYRPERQRYAELVGTAVRARVTFVQDPGVAGPQSQTPVDLLYIDSSHERQETIDELHAWRPVLRPGARVIFDDYEHPHYPGVREAVAELELPGEQRGTVFVHEVA
jgi:predicted O-methyltransferase YrrM